MLPMTCGYRCLLMIIVFHYLGHFWLSIFVPQECNSLDTQHRIYFRKYRKKQTKRLNSPQKLLRRYMFACLYTPHLLLKSLFISPKTTLHNQKHKLSAIATTPNFLPSSSKNIPSMHHTSANFPIFAYWYARSSYTNEWWTGATQPSNNQAMGAAIVLLQLVSVLTPIFVGIRMKTKAP